MQQPRPTDPPPVRDPAWPGPGAVEDRGAWPFLADVVRPLLDELAPADRMRALGRLRWIAGLTAAIVMLMPAYGPLGTGTPVTAHVVAGAWALVAIGAHLRRRRLRGEQLAVFLCLAAGGVTVWAGQGALWGMGLGGALAASLLVGAARRSRPWLPPPPVEPTDPMPARRGGPPLLLLRVAQVLITVLVLKGFVFEGMKVPTGSMSPTILGDRPHAGGDRLLVDRTAYFVDEPRRWDVCVFLYPLDRRVNFVKRLVGLPGETVDIRDGDVWIDGRPARKPPSVQETLWQEVFPRRAELSTKELDLGSAWKLSEDDGWRRAAGGGLRAAPRDGRRAYAPFVRRTAVADRRLSLSVEPEPGAAVVLEITTRGRLVRFRVPAEGAEGPARLEVAGGDGVDVDVVAVAGSHLSLGTWDGGATAFVDGFPLADVVVPAEGRPRHSLGIAVEGAGAVIRDLRVEQDLRYQGTDEVWTTPGDGYFLLGDQITNSVDSRAWNVTEFQVNGIATPVHAVEGTLSPEGRPLVNIARKDGKVTFTDVDGVPRSFLRSEIVAERRNVAVPFARRKHLIGRAVLIFWPWNAAEGGFRPRLLP